MSPLWWIVCMETPAKDRDKAWLVASVASAVSQRVQKKITPIEDICDPRSMLIMFQEIANGQNGSI